jgi:hypothetical protein
MNNKIKWICILSSTIIITAAVTACGTQAADTPSAPSPSAVSSPAASPAASPSASAAQPDETKQGTGVYVGLADNHTAAIQTDGQENSYQFQADLNISLESMENGDKVSFEYTEKKLDGGDTQLWLTKIAKAGASGVSSDKTTPTTSASSLAPAKDFSFKLEGNDETRTGKLALGQGFAMYVFDGFTFDTGLSLLTMDIDKNYYARIVKLPAGYKLEDIRKEAVQDLSKVGKVKELQGSDINPALGGAALLLLGSNDKLTQQVIVKEVDGTGYRIDVNTPHTEPSEGFGPHAFTTFGSIVNQ